MRKNWKQFSNCDKKITAMKRKKHESVVQLSRGFIAQKNTQQKPKRKQTFRASKSVLLQSEYLWLIGKKKGGFEMETSRNISHDLEAVKRDEKGMQENFKNQGWKILIGLQRD